MGFNQKVLGTLPIPRRKGIPKKVAKSLEIGKGILKKFKERKKRSFWKGPTGIRI